MEEAAQYGTMATKVSKMIKLVRNYIVSYQYACNVYFIVHVYSTILSSISIILDKVKDPEPASTQVKVTPPAVEINGKAGESMKVRVSPPRQFLLSIFSKSLHFFLLFTTIPVLTNKI